MVIRRNPEREARLLEEWRKGTPAREAASNTGVPEGTTFYYYRKFGKDPEKANRLARSLKPARKLNAFDLFGQSIAVKNFLKVQKMYNDLIEAGKFIEAESYIKAQAGFENYLEKMQSGVNSFSAYFIADPWLFESLAPLFAQELVQQGVQTGTPFLQAVNNSIDAIKPLLQVPSMKETIKRLRLALVSLGEKFIAEQEAKRTLESKPPRKVGLGELFPPHGWKEERAPPSRTGYALGELSEPPGPETGASKRVDLATLVAEGLKMDREESKRFEREAKARGQKVVNYPITFRTSQSPEGEVGGGPDPSGTTRSKKKR